MWESRYLLAIGQQFRVQNLDQLYVMASSALQTTYQNITDKVLGKQIVKLCSFCNILVHITFHVMLSPYIAQDTASV